LDLFSISSDDLQASVRARGAELCRLRTASGVDLLWDGDPAFWSGQSPVLFPVVGALKDGRLRHQGAVHPMTKHGFARDRAFQLVRLSAHACTLRLEDDAATRAMYPFPFRLDLSFCITGASLRVQFELHNPGELPLPASFGAHPAFRWPLFPDQPREGHTLTFDRAEEALLPTITADGLLGPATRPSPLVDRQLALADDLFTADALVFRPVNSRSVDYAGPGDATRQAATLRVAWTGFEQLGVWTKPGAGFVCIEPWRGYASPEGFDGEFAAKPGVFQVAPGATATAQYTVELLEPEDDD
jgi:galactose mutarotase-like enzyme